MLQLKVPVFNIYSPTKEQVCHGCGNQSNRWLKINVLTHLLLWEFKGLSFWDIRCPTDSKRSTPDTLTCKKLVFAMPCSRPRVQHKSNQLLAPGRGDIPPEKLAGWMWPASQNPYPILWPKSAIFPTLFMTWLLNQNPVFDQCYSKFPSSDQC